MARVCEICGKRPMVGHSVSHSGIRTKKRQLPNLQMVHAVIDGSVRTVRVCTRCIRSGKVRKAA